MDIVELRRLADWYLYDYDRMFSLFQNLLGIIQHNARESNKQPIESSLNNLTEFLGLMRLEELSVQQIKMLARLGVGKYIGREGADFVKKTIVKSDYDPATASNQLQEAVNAVTKAHAIFSNTISLADSLLIEESEFDPKGVVIRVIFQQEASIRNVVDWKDSSKDWHDIIRGVAMAVGEPPEGTRILGATTGSIILILLGSYAFSKILAVVAKNISSAAMRVIEVANGIEDLRHKKLLNQVIEEELKKQTSTIKAKSISDAMKDVKALIPDMDGEVENAIKKSIERYLDFNEKGGALDFVMPEEEAESQEDIGDQVASVRELITSYQQVREEIKRIGMSS